MKKIYAFLLLAGLFLLGAQNVMAQETYCVPGTHNGWNPAGDPMALGGDGYYFKIFESVTSFTFKISDGTWDNSWGYSNVLIGSCDAGIGVSKDGTNVVLTLASAADIMIKFNASTKEIWVVYYVTEDPTAHLSANSDVVLPGTEITLTGSSEHFTGTVSYAYSYSTDNTVWTSIAAAASATTVNFTIPANATAQKYFFKVVASSSTQSDDAETNVTVALSATVAGSDADYNPEVASPAFGTYWDMTDTNNDMVYSEDVFTLTKSKVYLPAKNLVFKVGINHDWGFSYPASDRVLEIPQAGYYDLTFTLTWSEKTISAVATYLYPKVEVAGTFNNWVLEELSYNPSGYQYKNIPVTAGNKEFKVIINDVWYGNNGTMTRISCENWTFASEADNCHLLADVDGYYTFYYQNDLVSVDFPNFKRTVGTNYISICLPYEVATLSNATAYEISSTSQDAVIITSVELPLDAGKPYIIKPTEPGEIEATFQNVNNKVTDNNYAVNGILHGNLTETPIVLDPNDAMDYFYVLSNNEVKLVAEGDQGDQVTVGQYRAYAAMPRLAISAPSYRIIEANNGATDINNVEANETAVKFIENGQLFIQKNGVVYNAVGAVVK